MRILRIDVGEYGRLHEEAVLVFAFVEAIAAARQFRAFVFANVDVAQISLQLLFVHGRAHVDGLIQTIADLQSLGAVDIAIDEFAVHALLHDDATGGRAALAGRTKCAPESAFDGEIEIRVVEHDHRILAAEFQRAMLETFRGGGSDDRPTAVDPVSETARTSGCSVSGAPTLDAESA